LTDEPAAVNVDQRAVDCYYCGACLVSTGIDDLRLGPTNPPPACRTARKRDLKFAGPGGVDAWVADMEKALEDEANNPSRDPRLPPITKRTMINRHGKRAFEGYSWYEPPTGQPSHP
jgi:hypothetical protein